MKKIYSLLFLIILFLNQKESLKSSSNEEEAEDQKQAEFKRKLEQFKNEKQKELLLEKGKFEFNEKEIEILRQKNKDLQRIMRPHDIVQFLWRTKSIKIDKERSSFKIGEEWGIRMIFVPSLSYKKILNKAFAQKKDFYEKELKSYFEKKLKQEKIQIRFKEDKRFLIFLLKGSLTMSDYQRSVWKIELNENSELKSIQFKADARSLRNQIEKIQSDYLDKKVNLYLSSDEEESYLEMELEYLSRLIDMEFKKLLINKYYIMRLLYYRAFNPNFYIWKGDRILESEFYRQFHLLIKKDSSSLDRFLIQKDLNKKINFMKIKEWTKPFSDFTWFQKLFLIKDRGSFLVIKIPDQKEEISWKIKANILKMNQNRKYISEDNDFIPLKVEMEENLKIDNQVEQIINLQNIIEKSDDKKRVYDDLDKNEKSIYEDLINVINDFERANYKLEKIEDSFIAKLLNDSRKKTNDLFLIFRNWNSKNNLKSSVGMPSPDFKEFYTCLKNIYELVLEEKFFKKGKKNYKWYKELAKEKSEGPYNPDEDVLAIYNIENNIQPLNQYCLNKELSLADFKLFEDFLKGPIAEAPLFKEINFRERIKRKNLKNKIRWIQISEHEIEGPDNNIIIEFFE